MNATDVIEVLTTLAWDGPYSDTDLSRAGDALEQGKVLYLPHLPFQLLPSEDRFLTADVAGGNRKNVSFDPTRGALGGSKPGPDADDLAAMLNRFGTQARQLLTGLVPRYAPHLERARTSFRPVEVKGREQTPRHDDRLLHVDAFPTRPMRGKRILRVFSNVSPDNSPREWRVAGDFAGYAKRFLPRIRSPFPGTAAIQAAIGLTKGKRSPYDALMLGLHDQGKFDTDWQRTTDQVTVHFPSGTTWMCFTDSVLHAAMAGRCALEQTFHIPVAAMAHPGLSPLHQLENLTGRGLI